MEQNVVQYLEVYGIHVAMITYDKMNIHIMLIIEVHKPVIKTLRYDIKNNQ